MQAKHVESKLSRRATEISARLFGIRVGRAPMKAPYYGLLGLLLGLPTACGGEAANGNDDVAADAGGMPDMATGPFDLVLDTEALDFGGVQIRTESPARVVTLENLGGEAITQLRAEEGLGFEGAFSFTLADDNLAPGASTELSVVFSPSELGSVSSTILLQASDGATSRSFGVDLSGEGIPVEVTATPASLDFGGVMVGLPNTQSFEMRNNGASVRTVEFSFSRDVDVCEGDVLLFCLVAPTPEFANTRRLELAPGGSQRFDVQFEAPGPSDYSGSIGYGCTDGGCGGEVLLRGSGVGIGPGG